MRTANREGRNEHISWASRFGVPLGILLIGLTVSWIVWTEIRHSEERVALATFEGIAEDRFQAIEREINASLQALRSVGAFYAATPVVDQHAFQTFVTPLLKQLPHIRAFEWVPLVSAQDRKALVGTMRANSLPQFRLTEKSASGLLVEAQKRETYFPVLYVEPKVGNEEILGFDFASEPARLRTLYAARDAGDMAGTEPLALVGETTGHSNIVIAWPVYKNRELPLTIDERREHLTGFVVASLRVRDIVESAMARFTPQSVDLHIRDSTDAASGQELYWFSARTRLAEAPDAVESVRVEEAFSRRTTVNVANRTWELRCTATSQFGERQMAWNSNAFLGGGILLSLMAAGVFWRVTQNYSVRKWTEQKLLDRDLRISSILETAVDAIFTIDELGRIDSFNPAAERLFGYAAKEVVGQNVKMLISPPFSIGHDQYLKNFRATGVERMERLAGTEREVTGVRKDGVLFPMDLAVSEMLIEGKQMFTGIIRDITARKQAEKQLQDFTADLATANDSLEQQNRRLAELCETAHTFVENVSHEFRTPLTVIKEFTSIMQDGLLGEITAQQNEYLTTILERSDDLATMIDDMLDISKLESGLLGIARKNCHVEEIVHRVRKTLERKAASHGIMFSVRSLDGLPPVYCDPEKIGRVLINLTINAIKFSPVNGKVLLWAEHDAREGLIRIGVSDEGPGIAADKRAEIFERFKQGAGNVRSSTKGFGLGLSIARELVSLNFGEIDIQSEVGKGSTFSFTIPTAEPEKLMERYLSRLEAMPSCSEEVSLISAFMDEPPDELTENKVEQFIQHQTRKNDLVLRLQPGRWLMVVCSNQQTLTEMIQNIEQEWKNTNRNLPNRPIASIALKIEGTWTVREERSAFLAAFKEAITASEFAPA